MTIQMSAHLSEETMNDVLIGLGSPESEAHLAACPACRSQLQQFQSGIHSFNAASMAWSEARSAAMPRPVPKQKTRAAILAPVGLALATAVLVAIGLLAWNHNPGSSQRYAAAPAPSQQNYEAQIAADNELMKSVDVALSTNEESPFGDIRMFQRPRPSQKTGSGDDPGPVPEMRNR